MSSSSLVLIVGVFVVALLAAVLFVSRRRTNTTRTSIHPDAKPVPSAPGATFIHQVIPPHSPHSLDSLSLTNALL
jgi:hypothetical protein